jgi:hypothetical protein
MCPSMRTFTCRFNRRVPQKITAVKCVNGCPKFIPDAGLVADMKFQFLNLTWVPSISLFSVEISEAKVYDSAVDTREELSHRIRQFACEVKNAPGIFECLRVSSSCRAELCVREQGGYYEHRL